MNNYELSRDRAQSYFLSFDQETVVHTWNLTSDDQWLYVTFLGRPYRICRRDGSIFRQWDGSQAGFNEVLSIYDLLCHQEREKFTSGTFAPVNSLKSRPRAIGVGTSFHTASAARFDRDPDAFQKACTALGGASVQMGDLGFRFPVFGPLDVILKFYHADEDFPASLTLLWDDETLRYIYYETIFYIAGHLLSMIAEEMDRIPNP